MGGGGQIRPERQDSKNGNRLLEVSSRRGEKKAGDRAAAAGFSLETRISRRAVCSGEYPHCLTAPHLNVNVLCISRGCTNEV